MENKARLIKLFHTLLTTNGVDNETKAVMLGAYGVGSSKELSEAQLTDLCNKLMKSDPKQQALDKARKRLLTALREWARLHDYRNDDDYLKGVAERAAGGTAFNKIPEGRLNSLYAAFKQQSKDLRKARELYPIAK